MTGTAKPRERRIRVLVTATLATVAVAVAGAGYVGYKRFLHIPKIRVTSVAEQRPQHGAKELRKKSIGAARHASPPSAAISGGDVESFYRASNQIRTVTATAVSSVLERKATLSSEERKQLEKVFKIGSNIQLGIDAQPSEVVRLEYQRKLIEQIELRLKLVLKDEQRYGLARSELSGLPRIDVDG